MGAAVALPQARGRGITRGRVLARHDGDVFSLDVDGELVHATIDPRRLTDPPKLGELVKVAIFGGGAFVIVGPRDERGAPKGRRRARKSVERPRVKGW